MIYGEIEVEFNLYYGDQEISFPATVEYSFFPADPELPFGSNLQIEDVKIDTYRLSDELVYMLRKSTVFDLKVNRDLREKVRQARAEASL